MLRPIHFLTMALTVTLYSVNQEYIDLLKVIPAGLPLKTWSIHQPMW